MEEPSFVININDILDSCKDYLSLFVNRKFGKIIHNDSLKQLKDKCFILIGETGAGKTSFLDLLFNYIKREFLYEKFNCQVKLEFERLDFSPAEISGRDQANVSSTFVANKYKIRINNTLDYFYVIDTPGLMDIGNALDDEKHLDSIYYKLKEMTTIPNIKVIILFFIME